MAKILISAGEISADIHGAKLATALLKRNPNLDLFGMGHQAMRQAGVKIELDLATASTIGLIEPLQYLPKWISAYYKMKYLLKTYKPDLFIPIDAQGFHMPLCRFATANRIRSIYYIAPQEWQWGTPKGGRDVVANTTKILSIFKDEAIFYRQLGGQVEHVGHPVQDITLNTPDRHPFVTQLGLNPQHPILSIFPGSRRQEIRHTGPKLIAAAIEVAQKIPNAQLVVSLASPTYRQLISQTLGPRSYLLYDGPSAPLIRHTALSFVASGTVTLEHAVLNTPCIVGYCLSPLSYWTIRKLLGHRFRNLAHIALPNILLGREVVPEFLQDQCTVPNLVEAGTKLMQNPDRRATLMHDYQHIQTQLGPPRTADRAADAIMESLNEPQKNNTYQHA